MFMSAATSSAIHRPLLHRRLPDAPARSGRRRAAAPALAAGGGELSGPLLLASVVAAFRPLQRPQSPCIILVGGIPKVRLSLLLLDRSHITLSCRLVTTMIDAAGTMKG